MTTGRSTEAWSWRALWLCIGMASDLVSRTGFAAPLPDGTNFNVICKVEWRVTADPHPDYTGTYPAHVKHGFRQDDYAIDLRRGLFCDLYDCDKFGAQRIYYRDKRVIVLSNDARHKDSIRRRDGRLRDIFDDDGRVTKTWGWCRAARYTGVPDKLYAPE